MKLHIMFLLMDMLLFLACGYFWLKYAFARVAMALEITKS
jgi:hypothetical protein